MERSAVTPSRHLPLTPVSLLDCTHLASREQPCPVSHPQQHCALCVCGGAEPGEMEYQRIKRMGLNQGQTAGR